MKAMVMLGMAVAAISGCAMREPCYQVVAVTPASGEYAVFNACNGQVEYRPLPAPPTHQPEIEVRR